MATSQGYRREPCLGDVIGYTVMLGFWLFIAWLVWTLVGMVSA